MTFCYNYRLNRISYYLYLILPIFKSYVLYIIVAESEKVSISKTSELRSEYDEKLTSVKSYESYIESMQKKISLLQNEVFYFLVALISVTMNIQCF